MNQLENNETWIDTCFNIVTKIIELVAMVCVGAMSLSLIFAVIFRKFFNSPVVGADEIALFLLVWVTLLGACLGLRKRDMVAVTFFIEKVSSSMQKKLLIVVQLLILGVSILLLYYGFQWITSTTIMNSSSAALQLPMWMPYSIFPIAMFIMVVFTLDNIRYVVKQKHSN